MPKVNRIFVIQFYAGNIPGTSEVFNLTTLELLAETYEQALEAAKNWMQDAGQLKDQPLHRLSKVVEYPEK